MADFTTLQQAIDALKASVSKAQGITASAVVLIRGIKPIVAAAVTKALEDDNAADQNSINAANAAINEAFAGLDTSVSELGAAVAENPGGTPPATPPTP